MMHHDIVPIVLDPLGHHAKLAPPHSYINAARFKSVSHLAEYLKELDSNDTLYNEYFQWRGTGQFINTYFFCRLCAMVNEAPRHPARWHRDFNEWWRGGSTCINGSWRDYGRRKRHVAPAAA